jgi:hypothetical protein
MPPRSIRPPPKAGEETNALSELRDRLELLQAGADAARRAEQTARGEVAKAWAKLHAQRESTERLKDKLQSEQKRSARLAARLQIANAAARAARVEADRALADARARRSELVLAAVANNEDAEAVGPPGAAGDASEGGLGAAEYFQLGRGFQSQGATTVASAAYRRSGPALKDFLTQEGPDGDRVSGPDFLVIGAARAGTTWLKKRLAEHPQVFILSGEHHYFSQSCHMAPETYVARFSGSHARFLRPGTNAKHFARPAGRLYGEKSTTYLSMPDAQIELCATLFPAVKVICMVRDPVQRVWSHLKHLAASGGMPLDRMAEAPPWAHVDELIRQCRYEEHLVRWATHLDPRQILLVDFTRLEREAAGAYGEVLSHIGADAPAFSVDPEQINATRPDDIPGELADRLRAALDGERFDLPHLREAMVRAAGAGRRDRPAAGPWVIA